MFFKFQNLRFSYNYDVHGITVCTWNCSKRDIVDVWPVLMTEAFSSNVSTAIKGKGIDLYSA